MGKILGLFAKIGDVIKIAKVVIHVVEAAIDNIPKKEKPVADDLKPE